VPSEWRNRRDFEETFSRRDSWLIFRQLVQTKVKLYTLSPWHRCEKLSPRIHGSTDRDHPMTPTVTLIALSRARSSRGKVLKIERRAVPVFRARIALGGRAKRGRKKWGRWGGKGGTPCALSSRPRRFDGRGHPVSKVGLDHLVSVSRCTRC